MTEPGLLEVTGPSTAAAMASAFSSPKASRMRWRARHLILLAFGAEKAEAIAAAVEGPVSSSSPGSVIQLHPHVTVLVDEAAASRLANIGYYRYAYTNKPAWQVV